MLKLIFHTAVLALNSYAMWFDQKYIDVPFSRAKAFLHLPLKGRSTFFTTWSLIIQTVYFAVATVNDVVGTDEALPVHTSLIRSIRDVLFSAFAVPSAMYAAGVFWSIYAINRELILPKKADSVIPGWLNHVMHTTVLLFAAVEMYISPHIYPPSSVGVPAVVSISFFYFLWKWYVYRATKTWVYPLFDALNWPLRACYCFGTAAISVIFYRLGETLNSLLWSSAMSQMKIV